MRMDFKFKYIVDKENWEKVMTSRSPNLLGFSQDSVLSPAIHFYTVTEILILQL